MSSIRSHTSFGESRSAVRLSLSNRLPSSKHATISQALAAPSPLIVFSSATVASPIPFSWKVRSIFFESVTTFVPLSPVRKRIARSSSSLSFSGPYFCIRSRGRSIFGTSFIRAISFPFVSNPDIEPDISPLSSLSFPHSPTKRRAWQGEKRAFSVSETTNRPVSRPLLRPHPLATLHPTLQKRYTI